MKFDIFDMKSSRRSVLKGISAAITAAAVTFNDKTAKNKAYAEILDPKADVSGLLGDDEVKVFHSSSSWNCGSKCVHNLMVKNGRVLKITSMGDIPREDSFKSDENIGGPGNPIQRRGCVRCYGYVQKNYQPDRLRYPLLQTKEIGNPNGFKRISWEEATTIVAKNYIKAVKEGEELGYLPIIANRNPATSFISTKNADKAIIRYSIGNHSTGAHDAAKFETVGVDAYCNSNTDVLNSKFILLWAIDPTRTTYWNENQHWYLTKAKEKGIPIVSITTNFSDTAASMATGVTTKIDGKNVTLPKWISCRPSTDGALAVAVAYVIYKNGWHDTEFLGKNAKDQAKRRCFGFYPEDEVISQTPRSEKDNEYIVAGGKEMKKDGRYRTFAKQKWYVDVKTPKYFIDMKGKEFPERTSFTGAAFKVTKGESFVEYLLSREVEWGGAKDDGVKTVSFKGEMKPIKYRQPEKPAKVGDDVYNKTLAYVSKVTGVSSDVIIALARTYSYIKPSCLFAGGGPQRSWNGQEWCNMMMGLTAMTGNISLSGGGTGYTMSCMADKLAYKSCVAPGNALSFSGNIMVTVNDWAHTVLTGKDYRSRERFIEDTVLTTQEKGVGFDAAKSKALVDLSKVSPNDPLLKVSFIYFRMRNNMITSGNTNKCIMAMKKVGDNGGFVMVQDQVMTPSALHANLVLPAASIWEYYGYYDSMYQGGNFLLNKIVEPLGDSKADADIENLITKKISELINEELPLSSPSAESAVKKSYETNPRNEPSAEYLAAYPKTKKPEWEEYKEKVVNEFPVGPERPFIGLRDPYADYSKVNPLGYGHDIGSLENSTGFINFWSPLWGYIDPYNRNNFNESKLKGAGVREWEYGMYGDGVRNATMCYEPNPSGYDKFFVDEKGQRGNVVEGKFDGIPSKIPGRGKYTMLYMTNKARHRSHTIFDNTAIVKDQFVQNVKIHPADAEKRGIKNGDMVYVYNDRGCTYLPAEVTYSMAQGILSIEHGAWYRAHPKEKVKISLNTGGFGDVAKETVYEVPVDVGGNENVLTDDYGTVSMQIGFAVSAQGGPCEISLVKPE